MKAESTSKKIEKNNIREFFSEETENLFKNKLKTMQDKRAALQFKLQQKKNI